MAQLAEPRACTVSQDDWGGAMYVRGEGTHVVVSLIDSTLANCSAAVRARQWRRIVHGALAAGECLVRSMQWKDLKGQQHVVNDSSHSTQEDGAFDLSRDSVMYLILESDLTQCVHPRW